MAPKSTKKPPTAVTDDQPGEQTTEPAKERRKPLSHGALVKLFAAQGGNCYVTGKPLGDHVATVYDSSGTPRLIGNAADDERGTRDLEGLRAKLITDLQIAQARIDAFGGLRDEDGYVAFAGEPKAESTGEQSGEPKSGAAS